MDVRSGMNTETDLTIEDMIRAAYRLSWPGPAPRPPTPVAQLRARVSNWCRREKLTGWPVVLSSPQG